MGLVLPVLAGLVVLASIAAGQDFGYEGPSYSGSSLEPTESKPESKLWFNDGIWWGALWSFSAQAVRIHRLDQATHVWTDIGVLIDSRSNSKADATWTGTKLYIGSHRFSSDGGASGNPMLVLRYSYDAQNKTYTLDAGFPVTISNFSTESLVLERDSTSTVWAVWVQNLRVFFSHTIGGNDLAWTGPAILPTSDNDFTTDEVCSIVHFDGNKIGVMWSDQDLNLFHFAIHQDGTADDQWTRETALNGESDDHINLATDADGRVFATVKNVVNEIKLIVRDDGVWSQYLIASSIDRFTRPIVLVDEESRKIHVFASGQDNGMILEKVSSLDTIAFPPGPGTIVLRDASNPLVNNATSTKQNVDSTTGIVVLAAHETTGMYWHHSVPPAALLVARFSATPLTGPVPLNVQFTDLSTGAPTTRLWDFGDGDTSTAQNPSHVYDSPGTFSVGLTVNGAGSDSETWADLVTVTQAFTSLTFAPLADARVNEAAPGSNAGTATELRLRFAAGGSYQTFLRFDLSSLTDPPVSAKLRLFCTDGSTVGGSVFTTTNSWTETGITWNNKPGPTSAALDTLGSISAGVFVEYDVTPAISAGVLSFVLTTSSSNSALFSSREGANPPELVVQVDVPQPTVAEFTAAPTSGTTPLSVSFTDLSTGAPTSWSWSFGDGGTSTAQNPNHVYASAGQFTVSLTADGPGGPSTETKTEYIVASAPPAPVAGFSASPTSGTAPLSVTFTDASTGTITSRTWDFGDGSQTSSALNPVHVYAAGTYTVTLTVSGPGGTDDEIKTDYIVVSGPPAPVAGFSASPTSGTAPLSVTFTDASTGTITSRTWNFGDGSQTSSALNPVHVYAAGTYTVTLTVSGPGGTDDEIKTDHIVVSGPPAPIAAFSASPTSGTAPLSVTFTDASTGNITSRSWTFGDGGTSTAVSPVHVYQGAGSFTVTLTVTGPGGSDDETKTDHIVVTSAPSTQTFTPVADARVNEGSPSSNAGTATEIRTRFAAGGSYHSYLRFDLTGLSGSVTSAKLRLFCTDDSPQGGLVFPTSSGWVETAITWNNKPAATGAQIAALGPVAVNAWVEVDVTSAIGTPGLESFLLTGTTSNSALFSSREAAANKPQLVVQTGAPQPPVAAFSGTPLSGTAPLSVTFTDASTGSISTRSWTFGDGGTSTAQNPVHVYQSAGNYTVTLTVDGPNGSDIESKTDYIAVGAPGQPLAAFSASPTSGTAPLSVTFTDASTGSITSRSWNFGDGGSSTQTSPTHVYTTTGLFTVTLTVNGPGGTDDEIKTDHISVSPAPPITTLVPVADARVNEGSPSSNAGTSTELRTRFSSGGSYHSYLRFDLSGLSGTVVSAKLRLFCTDDSPQGGLVFPTSSGWGETTINWNNKPAATGGQIAALGPVAVNTWVEVDVTSAIGALGPTSFLVTGTNSNSAIFSSREVAANKPQLVVQTGAAQAPVANFSGTPTSGAAPLSVTFTDLSTNNPTSWSWSFGDGGTSTQRNPVHVYASPGTFDVTLQATNAIGSSSFTRTSYIGVTPAPPITTLAPVADARVNEGSPTSNAGTATEIRTRLSTGGSYHSYLRFDASGITAPIVSAKLRLFCTDESPQGGLVFPTSSGWIETTINWNNKPAATGGQIASLGAVANGAWVEVDVTAAIGTPGLESFLLTATTSNSALFSSREGANPPQLVIETAAP